MLFRSLVPGELRTVVARIFEEVLGIDAVEPSEDFFADLGGHSIAGAAVVGRVSDYARLPLELRDLYLAPTAAELEALLKPL